MRRVRADIARILPNLAARRSGCDALRWVLVTVVDTALVLYEAIFGRLPEATLARYLAEAAHLGRLVGQAA